MPYATVDDFRLGMDVTKPRVAGLPGSLWELKNGVITRGGHISRSKKFVSTYVLPETATSCPGGVSRARQSLTVTTGVTGGQLDSLTVGGTELLGSSVAYTTDEATTAQAVVDEINANTSGGLVHGWSATRSGATITILAPANGTSYNDLDVTTTITGGDLTFDGDQYFSSVTALVDFETSAGTDTPTETIESDNATVGGDATIGVGFFNSGGIYDGDGDYHWFGNATGYQLGSGEFTVEGWVQFDTIDAGSDQFVLGRCGGSGNRSWRLIKNTSDQVSFGLSFSGGAYNYLTDTTGITAGSNFYFAIDRDGSDKVRFYIDGLMVDSATLAGLVTPGTAGLQFGWKGTTIGENATALDGKIDAFRITKGVARYASDDGHIVPKNDPSGSVGDYPTDGSPSGILTFGGCDAGTSATFGLHRLNDTIYTFGGFADPGVPSGVTYQRLQHATQPDTVQMSKLLDSENFDGKIYAIAEYTDGSIYHFYDGTRVTAWDNISASISSNATVASALKDKIDLHPDFVATVATDTVTIEAAVAGVDNSFTIAAEAQNFGSVNDQEIVLAQVVAAADTTAAATATGSVTITGGSEPVAFEGSIELVSGGSGSVDTITVNGVDVLGATVPFNSSLTQTATDVAAQISSYTSTPDYTATAAGKVVTIIANANAHPSPDGYVVDGTSTTITLGNKNNMAGGEHNMVGHIFVDGVQITTDHVPYNTSNTQTAADVATEINGTTSTPNYSATSSNNVVTISAPTAGSSFNGLVVAAEEEGDVTVGATNMQGGADAGSAAKEKWTAQITGTFEAADIFTITLNGEDFTVQGAASGTGETVLTFKSKLYSTVSSLLYFSALGNATQWEQPAIGAGFLDIATKDEGSTDLWGAGVYQDSLGLYSRDSVVIEYVDEDETLNAHLYTAKNTGSRAHRSIVQFGNNDLFYLDELSGVRSLRARDSSNAPETDDVGTPIDEHILDYIDTISEQIAADAVGMIGEDGRYWLAINNRIYIFSFFKRAKVSAWSYFEPDAFANEQITGMVRTRKKTWVRAGDIIYLYGGDGGDTYPGANEDNCVVKLPFMAVEKPAHYKTLTSLDIAALNDWTVQVRHNPNDETKGSAASTLTDITYPNDAVGGVSLRSTHFAPELTCSAAGKAELYNLAVHYNLDEAS